MSTSLERLAQLTENLPADPYAALNKIFDTSVDLLCVVKTDGFFAKVSNSFVDALGFSREHLMTTPFFEMIHPDDIQPSIDCWTKTQAGQPTDGFKNRYITVTGDYKTLVWSLPGIQDGVAFSVARIEKSK